MESGKLKIGNHIIDVLIAKTTEEQSIGLMYRKWKPPAMAFVYSYPKSNTFWMKNTPSPLDIVFCLDKKIIAFKKGEPFSLSTIDINKLSDLVVELPLGTVEELSLKINDEVYLK